MKNLATIEKKLKTLEPLLKERFKVKRIGIFGSYLRGEEKRKNDIDILVEFEETVSLLQLVSLENFLKETLGIKVDVVPKEDIRFELKDIILRETIYL